MIEALIQSLRFQIENRIYSLLDSKFWKWKLAILSYIIVIFFSFLELSVLSDLAQIPAWEVVPKQIENPFANELSENPNSHESKRTFRLLVPMLFAVLQIDNIILIYLFQQLVVLLLFYFVSRLAWQISHDKITSALFVFAVAFTYIVQCAVVDFFAKFAVFAITALIGTMCFRNAFNIFLLCSIAAWTDERGLLASSFVFIWWKVQENPDSHFLHWLRPQEKRGAVILSILFYAGLRLFLSDQYNMHTSVGLVGPDVLVTQFNMLFFGLWSGLEALWVLVLLSFIALYKQK